MHITNFFVKSVLGSALTLVSLHVFAVDSDEHSSHADHQHHTGHHAIKSDTHSPQNTQKTGVASYQQQPELLQQQHALNKPQNSVRSARTHDHRKEHGAQMYSQIILDQKWQHSSEGNGAFKSENQARIGNDENKIVLELQAEKQEFRQAEYETKLLYSRNISDFWDVQTGVRYRQENLAGSATQQQNERFDAVVGLHGLAPYFFETDAHLYVGEDDFVGLKLETERDLLLTQKLILQPFIELEVILKDHAPHAKKTGLSHATLGLETRYELSKKFMPYLEVGYEYSKGNQQTAWQQSSDAEKGWIYAAGLRMMF